MKSSSSAPSRFSWRAGVAGSVAFALGGAGLLSAHPAQAAEVNVSDAVFSWGINAESGAGAYYPGSCNFLSAGVSGDAGKADVWSKEDAEAKKLFSPEEGNVKILRPTADGGTLPITWDNKCQTPEGERVNTYNGETAKRSGNFVEISGGKGTIDAETKSGTIEWEGSFTVVYYSGFTYWSVSNPKLEVKNGKGKITGTFSGYGADMADLSKWEKLKPAEGTIADFGNNKVELDENGFTVTPDYEGVDSGQPDQNKEKDGWGSFPKSWVDYNVQTGQAQYWYSSGGAADPRKKPTALTVKYKAEEPEAQVDEETIKNTTKSTHSVSDEGLAVNVTGKGYSVLPKASTGKDANGVYVAVVDRKVKNSEIELSRPSAKAASAAEKSSKEPVAVEYIPGSAIKDGKLNAKVTTGADKLNKDTDYDTVVWVAHGNPNDETVLHRSNINLTDEQKNTLFPAEEPQDPEPQDPKEPEAPDTPDDGGDKPTETDTKEPKAPGTPDDGDKPKEPEAKDPEAKDPAEPGTPDDGGDKPTETDTTEPEAPGTPDDGDKPKEPEAKDPEAKDPTEPGTPDDGDKPKEPEAKDPEAKDHEGNEPDAKDPEEAPEAGENDKGNPEAKDPEDQKPGAEAPGADKPGTSGTSGSHESNAKPSPTASNSLPRTGGTNLAIGIAGITLLAVGAVAMTISRRRP